MGSREWTVYIFIARLNEDWGGRYNNNVSEGCDTKEEEECLGCSAKHNWGDGNEIKH